MSWENIKYQISKPISQDKINLATDLLQKGLASIEEASQEADKMDQKSLEYYISRLFNNNINKEADLKSMISKSFPGKLLGKVVPLLSFFFGAYDVYQAYFHFKDLFNKSNKVGLTLTQSLVPYYLDLKVDVYEDDIDQLLILCDIIKSARDFNKRLISAITNIVDGIKDFIFMIADILTYGTSVIVDVGLSFVFVIIDFVGEGYVDSVYNEILKRIENIADQNIADLNLDLDKTQIPI
jgi:hypothetical protein